MGRLGVEVDACAHRAAGAWRAAWLMRRAGGRAGCGDVPPLLCRTQRFEVAGHIGMSHDTYTHDRGDMQCRHRAPCASCGRTHLGAAQARDRRHKRSCDG